MSTLITIMAHAEAQDTFNRHLPYWHNHGCDILVMCPQDSVVKTLHTVVAIGTKSHHGSGANRRFRNLIRLLSKTEYDRFVIFEYDALCFGSQIPEFDNDSLWSNLFTDESNSFEGHHFLHPPLMASKAVITAFSEALEALPDNAERNFWDRAAGLACERSNIPMRGYGARGFSKNTIEPHDIPAAVAARKAGASLFHGIKSLEVLRLLTCA